MYVCMYVYIGFDIVVAIYEGQRYEVEMKYTTFVDIQSRPTLPRYIYTSTHGHTHTHTHIYIYIYIYAHTSRAMT